MLESILIRVNTRPSWQQSVAGSDLHVRRRMQQIAAGESIRVPSRDVTVTAHDEEGELFALHWPAEALAFWVLRSEFESGPGLAGEIPQQP